MYFLSVCTGPLLLNFYPTDQLYQESYEGFCVIQMVGSSVPHVEEYGTPSTTAWILQYLNSGTIYYGGCGT